MQFLIGVLIAYLIYQFIMNGGLKKTARRERRFNIDRYRERDEYEKEVYEYLKERYDK